MGFIKELLKIKDSGQTIFTFADLNGLISGYSSAKLKSALKYAVKKNDIIRLSRGIYSLSNDYSRLEFANKYRSPSYISLYTILTESGIVFQPYSSIYLISDRSQEVEINERKYIYRKIKDEILLNPLGISNMDGVFKASPERAICDKIYLDGEEYFDNLRNINWEMIKKINIEVYNTNQTITKWILQNTKQI